MKKEEIIRFVAGGLVALGVGMAYYIGESWLLLPLFVGVMLFQSSITKVCPMEKILTKMGKKD
ncbi:TPA: DUF2892 domain-containing protein [candidate division CPR2 bacterium]|uniref:Inner membrane protein YgaP-like transmembrane domain-containing protein n=1 Tax=candidate division CPR2 bacterium GW2011_GWC1_41_48 TaxID=1618344 RepID=A0A0G0W7V5_UNCC2|nr:MAG: hypothetical protein UT47_C0003G0140 [candidate division CPR2 bacterium GW2011_GWC2_39_35]KKR28363.1 MAG: hypothetical protein UT60_C0022G0019 [candidate division CPR2 bacterium GW2011_GWD2_39_7]KKR29125.1 MAG: hypothetical protein UT59_C0012G0002 [candidate division CPR2 bacterium GW2011_GWD1_39_7]KKS09079.1 MAG: hypothetical protein UU65_C0003G0134 [candidate division CPR2 bacterium GW2011_GWC1_41_48]OGB62140.1 MAG: hypothetical protein A2Y27_00575 [candidate division CPR2 bacterium G